jgi:hypothetical protein
MIGYRLMLMRMWIRMWTRGPMLGGVVAFALFAAPAAGIVLGQVDDFQNGTLQNWGGGASPFNVSTGGPDGDGDRYLRISTAGGNLGANNVAQWTGDYIAEDVLSVNVHLNNLGANPLSIRLSLFGPDGTYSSTIATVLPAASGWVSVEFLLDEAEFTQTQGFATFDQVLASVQTLLLRHDPDPIDPPGTPNPVTGTLGIDNITALPEPGVIPVLATGIATLLRLRAHRLGRSRSSS